MGCISLLFNFDLKVRVTPVSCGDVELLVQTQRLLYRFTKMFLLSSLILALCFSSCAGDMCGHRLLCPSAGGSQDFFSDLGAL